MCDAGAPSLAPPFSYNGPAQPPLNNSRPEARRGSRSRPSRPVYEGKKIQKSIENFIPRELDDFGPDSLDVRRNENGLHREKGNYGFDEVTSAPMNNEIPRRVSSDRALERETLVRNTDNTGTRKQLQRKATGGNIVVGETAMGNSDLPHRPPRKETSRVNGVARKHQQRKTSGDNPVVGETAIGNSDLNYRPRRKEASRAKRVAVDPLEKRSSELRNGFASDTHQAPVVKPTESSMGQIKMNTGAARKPANERARLAPVLRTRDITNGTVSIWTKGSVTPQSGCFLESARPLFRIGSSCVKAKGD